MLVAQVRVLASCMPHSVQCAAGLVSRELAPHAKCIVGVDISQNMVDHYNQSVANQGIPPEEMRAVCCDLTAVPDQLDGMKFDVVVVSLPVACDSYHRDDAYNFDASVHPPTTISLPSKTSLRLLHHT